MRLLLVVSILVFSLTTAQAQQTTEKAQEAFAFGEQAAVNIVKALVAAFEQRFADDKVSYTQAIVTLFAQLDAYRRYILDDKPSEALYQHLSDYFTDELTQGKALRDRERSN